MMTDYEVFSELIKAVVALVSVLLTAFVIPWLNNKIGAEKLSKIEEITRISVRCAEQIYTPEEWKLKKQYVLAYITEKANEIGLEMTETDLNNLIEGIVNEVKKG